MKGLILKNLQNDFLESGAIPLRNTASLIVEANKEMEKYDVVMAIQKWYPADHHSFAANHPWRKPGQVVTIEDKEVTLQIIHCVAESFGADFPTALNQEKINYIIKDTGTGSDPIMAEINRIVKAYKIGEIDIFGPEIPEERSGE